MGMQAHQASPPGDAPQWPYHSFLPLGALPGAIPCARLHTTAVLWEWGMEALTQPAELAVSELVTNAVRHAGLDPDDRVEVVIAAEHDVVSVRVTDHGSGGPRLPAQASFERDSGRGLLLVTAIADRWNVQSRGGTTVLFELDCEPSGWPRHFDAALRRAAESIV